MIVTGGTRYVAAPSRPALVRANAYAYVVNASPLGIAPRNTTHLIVDAEADPRHRAGAVLGDHQTTEGQPTRRDVTTHVPDRGDIEPYRVTRPSNR